MPLSWAEVQVWSPNPSRDIGLSGGGEGMKGTTGRAKRLLQDFRSKIETIVSHDQQVPQPPAACLQIALHTQRLVQHLPCSNTPLLSPAARWNTGYPAAPAWSWPARLTRAPTAAAKELQVGKKRDCRDGGEAPCCRTPVVLACASTWETLRNIAGKKSPMSLNIQCRLAWFAGGQRFAGGMPCSCVLLSAPVPASC